MLLLLIMVSYLLLNLVMSQACFLTEKIRLLLRQIPHASSPPPPSSQLFTYPKLLLLLLFHQVSGNINQGLSQLNRIHFLNYFCFFYLSMFITWTIINYCIIPLKLCSVKDENHEKYNVKQFKI